MSGCQRRTRGGGNRREERVQLVMGGRWKSVREPGGSGGGGGRGEIGNLCDTADERGTFFIMFCPVQRA